jgi:hypothetical protein
MADQIERHDTSGKASALGKERDLHRQAERLHARYRELMEQGDEYRAYIVFRALLEVTDDGFDPYSNLPSRLHS